MSYIICSHVRFPVGEQTVLYLINFVTSDKSEIKEDTRPLLSGDDKESGKYSQLCLTVALMHSSDLLESLA